MRENIYEKTLLIVHLSSEMSRYCHLTQNDISPGDQSTIGDIIFVLDPVKDIEEVSCRVTRSPIRFQ